MASKLALTLTCPRPFTALSPRPLIPISSLSSPGASGVHLIQFNGRHLCLRRRLFLLSPKATADQRGLMPPSSGNVEEDEVVDGKILPYCSIDKKEKKSVGELEQDFLQALQAFYYEGKAILSNEEFDNLKEELRREGITESSCSCDKGVHFIAQP